MDILHIGGVADGEALDLAGNVMTGRQSFKLSTDLPAGPLRHHDYERQIFMVRRADETIEGEQLMVWNGLPKTVVYALIEARLNVKIEA